MQMAVMVHLRVNRLNFIYSIGAAWRALKNRDSVLNPVIQNDANI